MRNKKFLYYIDTLEYFGFYANASHRGLDTDRCSELVYVTNTTIKRKMRFLPY